MSMEAEPSDAGGFFLSQNAYPTPTPSSPAPSSTTGSPLPKPRSHPLRPASSKESTFINYIDQKLLRITRRYAKKFISLGGDQPSMPVHEATSLPHAHDQHPEREPSKGYENFREVAKDLEAVADLVWASGTPTLQVAYLLSVALLAVTYLPSFAPAPKAMFRLLGKLDIAFASLVEGRDLDSGAPLPGMENRRGLSGTEKVRIKSLVERTRVVVMNVMQEEGAFDEEQGEDYDDDDDDDPKVNTRNEENEIDIDDIDMDYGMEIARVYDRTLQGLGDELGGPPIGIQSQ